MAAHVVPILGHHTGTRSRTAVSAAFQSSAVGFVLGCGGQLVNVTVMTVRQAVTPDGMQGRAATTITFAGMGMAPHDAQPTCE